MNDSAIRQRMHERQLALMGRLLPGHAARLRALEESIHPGYRFPWRIAEAPAIIPRDLFDRDLDALRQILSPYFTESFRARQRTLAPPRFRRPDDSGLFPRFIATDYQRAWDADRGTFTVCCPEIQSFPGNTMLKPMMIDACLPALPEFSEADCYLDDGITSPDDYLGFLREHVLRDHVPADTVVVEISPESQATFVDQMLTARHIGCRIVGLEDLSVDPQTHEVTYRRAIDVVHGSPRTVEYDTPVVTRNLLCRCLPDEIDELLADPNSLVTRPFIERLFQDTLLHGTADWVVHPHDFFVLSKATLVGNPHHYPPLRPLDARLEDALHAEGLRLEDGVIKPAFGAGGRGVLGLGVGVEGKGHGAILQRELERSDEADPMTMLLWQEKYGSDTYDRAAVPGFVPDGPEEHDQVQHELRVMWAARVSDDGTDVVATPLCGLTRWGRAGAPANARHQRTTFTGTQGILIGE